MQGETWNEPTSQGGDYTPVRRTLRKLVLRSALPGDEGSLELIGTRFTLGRAHPDQLPITQSGVSRAHAEIVRHNQVCSIRDLRSTNGTFVDGIRVEHVRLQAGSIIRLGEWLGVVEEHDADERGPYHFRELAPGVYGGALLARCLAPLLRVAESPLPIVLVGATGTGKERFARAAHLHSMPALPFQAVNCAALPAGLAEAELFGYRRGAFTGAAQSHAGHLRAAGKGTLFLDEIAELPLSLQAKLLRALDTGDFVAIGETDTARFQARVIAACQLPLAELVALGAFRDDLAARLGGLVVFLPELRVRRGDVPSLFDAFLARHSARSAPRVSPRLFEWLCLRPWHGNVRELELLARRMLAIHGRETVLRRFHLPPELLERERAEQPVQSSEQDVVGALRHALHDKSGNVQQAAKEAGLSRHQAYRLIQANGLAAVISAARQRRIRCEDGADG